MTNKTSKPLTPFGVVQRKWGPMSRLAREAKISVSTIRRLVYGETGHKPNPLTVARLAEVMHIAPLKMDAIMKGSWEETAKKKEAKERPAAIQETVEEVQKHPWWKQRQPAPFGKEAAALIKAKRDKERMEFLKRKRLVAEEKDET